VVAITLLEKTNGRIKGKNDAAAILGLRPSTLYSGMHRLDLPPKRKEVE
jgi:hypothetical protein